MFTINRSFITLGFLALIALSGCASILNPYSSDFTCPKTEGGKCVSVNDAYTESLQQRAPLQGGSEGKNEKTETAPADLGYQASLYKKMQRLLDDPVTPIVVPPIVMRVLFLPYPGDDHELYGYRYAFMFVDEPRWLLGDYLRETPGAKSSAGRGAH
jgi:conjugal transfer pilus assembly protein TraV